MKQILITENSKQKLFQEALSMDKARGVDARNFRLALLQALKNGNYQFDELSNKIFINGYSYEIGKKYAEKEDGEPIPLHYTFNTVNKYIMDNLF